MKAFYFVYQKDDQFKALDFDDAKAQGDALKADGWKHIATLDAPAFIEFHYKEELNTKQ